MSKYRVLFNANTNHRDADNPLPSEWLQGYVDGKGWDYPTFDEAWNAINENGYPLEEVEIVKVVEFTVKEKL